jgi:hypothetical protein
MVSSLQYKKGNNMKNRILQIALVLVLGGGFMIYMGFQGAGIEVLTSGILAEIIGLPLFTYSIQGS